VAIGAKRIDLFEDGLQTLPHGLHVVCVRRKSQSRCLI
jgi:hypothetical protein